MKRCIVILAVSAVFLSLMAVGQVWSSQTNCYEGLAWGMNKEQAAAALAPRGILGKAQPAIGEMRDAYNLRGGVQIGAQRYNLTLYIDNTGLYKVIVEPRESAFEPAAEADIRITAYTELKKSLEKTYGPPSRQLVENKEPDTAFKDALLKAKAKLLTQWENDQGLIVLTAQAFEPVQANNIMFFSLITYERKNAGKKQ